MDVCRACDEERRQQWSLTVVVLIPKGRMNALEGSANYMGRWQQKTRKDKLAIVGAGQG